MMPLAGAAEQTVEVRPPSTPVHVYGDGTRLVQIFTNVLNNAVKFTPRAGHIRFTADERPGEAVVCLRDSGMGIAPDLAARLRHVPPGRAGARTIGWRAGHRPDAGAAAGGDARGRIDISSPGPRQGTEVEIRLPISAVPVDELAVDEQPAEAVSHRLRVLIVEDNQDAAEMLDMAVSRLGRSPGWLTTAPPPWRSRARRDLPRHRPAGDGGLRPSPAPCGPGRSSVTSISRAVTGWRQEDDRRKAREAGVDSHFTKPLSPAALGDVLGTVARRVTSGSDERATPRTRRTYSDPAF